jgi:hypothetical protein
MSLKYRTVGTGPKFPQSEEKAQKWLLWQILARPSLSGPVGTGEPFYLGEVKRAWDNVLLSQSYSPSPFGFALRPISGRLIETYVSRLEDEGHLQRSRDGVVWTFRRAAKEAYKEIVARREAELTREVKAPESSEGLPPVVELSEEEVARLLGVNPKTGKKIR